jgi:hypothetical protein
MFRDFETNVFGAGLSSFYIETTNSNNSSSGGMINLRGGGKFIATGGQASILRVNLSGTGTQDTGGEFQSSGDVQGSLMAFDFLTRKLIQSTAISQIAGSSVSEDKFVVKGQGVADVNGVPTDITFELSKIGDAVGAEIDDANSGEILVNGTGEPNRATLQLTLPLSKPIKAQFINK